MLTTKTTRATHGTGEIIIVDHICQNDDIAYFFKNKELLKDKDSQF